MWILGGQPNDIWYSSDGFNWTRINTPVPWSRGDDRWAGVLNGRVYCIRDDIWSTTDMIHWRQDAPCIPRWRNCFDMGGASFLGKIWMTAGRGSDPVRSSVWSTPNGADWTQRRATSPWAARWGHTSVVHNNRLWVIGGTLGELSNPFNDVWWSLDGRNWTSATLAAAWSPRQEHASTVFNNKMWVLGGGSGTATNKNDVWYSSDGVRWTSATLSAPWPPMRGHVAVSFKGLLWVMGQNVIYNSPDGRYWRFAGNTPGRARENFGAAVCGGRIWLTGGEEFRVDVYPPSYFYYNDVWSSHDGVHWQREATPPWSARSRHALVAHNNILWLFGGLTGSGYLGDVWYSRMPSAASPLLWQRYR